MSANKIACRHRPCGFEAAIKRKRESTPAANLDYDYNFRYIFPLSLDRYYRVRNCAPSIEDIVISLYAS